MAEWVRGVYGWLTGTLPPPEFAVADPPDWLADVRVRVLPPGREYRFRVQVWPGRTVVADTARALWCSLAPPGREEFVGERAADLLGLIERAFGAPAPHLPNLIEDGLPCQVRLFRREPFAVVRQSLNLAGWWYSGEAPGDLPPAVQLTAILYRKVS